MEKHDEDPGLVILVLERNTENKIKKIPKNDDRSMVLVGV
ncbi:hypothetical protein AALP_AAs44026U000100 [Arabis alpina]|uniref:Uncharacterized protein n=1 Tax=Arabis alpina TaxID=50452 RepID=A0A087FYV9_ARAAL|nr:hypothetical protein AALP_AAs44026U000100 [Arabis alpina]